MTKHVTVEPSLSDEERAAVLNPVDHPEGFRSLWVNALTSGGKEAQEENAKLGLDSPGTHNGRPAVLTPEKKIKYVKDFSPKLL